MPSILVCGGWSMTTSTSAMPRASDTGSRHHPRPGLSCGAFPSVTRARARVSFPVAIRNPCRANRPLHRPQDLRQRRSGCRALALRNGPQAHRQSTSLNATTSRTTRQVNDQGRRVRATTVLGRLSRRRVSRPGGTHCGRRGRRRSRTCPEVSRCELLAPYSVSNHHFYISSDILRP